MEMVLTAKLKLHATPEQFRALRQTQLAYRDALNYVSRYAFAHGKLSNKVGLQVGPYQELRARFGLPAQRLSNALDQGQSQRGGACRWSDQKAVPGHRCGAPVHLAHAHLPAWP